MMTMMASVSAFVNSNTKLSKNSFQEAVDKLFTNVIYHKLHVLRPTLPGIMDTKYHLRPRLRYFKLIIKNRSITECDFITRLLLKTFIHITLVRYIATLRIYFASFHLYRLLFTVILSHA